jgi:AraC-like DNA-binding protein
LKRFGLLRIATFERDVRGVDAFSSINVDTDVLEPGVWLLWASEPSTVDYLDHSIYLLKREMLVLPGDAPLEKGLASFSGRILYVPTSVLGLPEQTIDFALHGPLQPSPGWADILSAYLGSLNLATLRAADASPVGRALIERHTLGLLRLMLSTLAQTVTPLAPGRRSAEGREDLWRNLQTWLREHYSDTTVTTQTAADHFSVSIRYIHKLFADFAQGKTFLGLLQELRLNRAKELLQSDIYANLTIAEVGWLCGYADPVYFGKTFRKCNGMTPGLYRRVGYKQQNNSY